MEEEVEENSYAASWSRMFWWSFGGGGGFEWVGVRLGEEGQPEDEVPEM
jgi:hypothetical protein